jgi:ribonuclease BN (tRNA processing enzyme)
MRLTVLGSSASYAGAGQACAGYYLEGGDARVLFDCGNGTLANLGRIADPLGLDAVFVSHGHIDHFADVYSLHAALRYAPEGPRGPLPLYLPAGLFERMKCLLSARGAAELDEAFVPVDLEAGVAIALGGLTVTPVAVDHTDPTFALIAEADGARLVYTSDTRPCGGVSSAAIGADLLLAEATLPEPYAGAAPHMTAAQAGELAREAGARALVLTHVWPTNDRELMARIAAESFGCPVVVASELDTFDIAPKVGKDH